ncbi:MAG: pyridoxal phosphate-dependent aminotransferase family protein [Campylobacteraceae bacterium]|jgi:8-amino-7-oxononanoate synthase|nr:pyridoxal phosphate-dependent aminotransferase family protein [Campylobacteraceae bacterium]MBT3881815.1 pyridoxal phosphate-dependent aminotransferase family protein [Campylobacteraceae bacterium]MBT4030097.1 pyridoxal phosphate-dependent aminotransferase family protein [Campylobacteraceae bacterium]MBT4179828.1 pyridoxal phosphate-dependent aminotransferase family protein [Campylobacteraceae bacterium]MBT4571969.1 pyridoxal phosphate-dependent aminotransferase family protein [Campylobacter
MYFKKELAALRKANRFRQRYIFEDNLKDLASNDYLGLAENKKIFKKTIKRVLKEKSFSPKASMIVNGYSKIHQEFEQELCKVNNFENGIIVGSGFLANISLIESMIRKNDILLIDEQYHASGILASSLCRGEVIVFKHNDIDDLKTHLENINKPKQRIIIAIEGIYSMQGDIAPKEISDIADNYNALLLVDEAHSSGVIGSKLLGWFDHFNIAIKSNHIKMGTLGKAYGAYGAYILASNETISFLENRAKPIIYSTAPSIIDTAIGHESLKYILTHKIQLKKKIQKRQALVKNILGIEVEGLIVPIEINNNQKVLEIQKTIRENGFNVGAIRQPTVKKAIIRLIAKIDISKKELKKVLNLLNSQQ